MEKNVGGFDRTARLIVGLLFVVAGLAALLGVVALELWLAVVALLVGAVLAVTGWSQQCPAYRVLGVDTLRPGADTERDDLGAEEAQR